jgi:hypothetical protein
MRYCAGLIAMISEYPSMAGLAASVAERAIRVTS